MPVDVIENDMAFTIKMKDMILFIWMFLLFIFSWISVAVVGRAIDNLCFSTLGLSDKSTLHTTIIAVVVVSIEILTLYYFNTLGYNMYVGGFNLPGGDDSSNDDKSSSEDSCSSNILNNIVDDENSVSNYSAWRGIDKITRIEGITLI